MRPLRTTVERILGSRARLPIVWAAVSGIVLLRQNYALTRPQFIWEETAAWWATTFTFDPLRYLIEPWSGYLVIPARAAFLIARLGPPEIAPAVTIVLHAAAIGLVAALLASNRLAGAIPDTRVRVAFGISIALLPLIAPYQSVLSGQWFFAIAIAGISLSPPRRWDYPVMVIASFSGPATLITLPLFWLRWRPSKWRVVDGRGVVMALCALVQAISLATSEGRPMGFAFAPVIVVLIIMLGVALVLMRALPFRTQLAFGYLAAITLFLGLFAMGYWGRYFLALWALVALGAVIGIVERRRAAIALATWFTVLAVGTFFSPMPPDVFWRAHARCIGGPDPCVVPADPPEWSVTWPGDPKLYVAPKDWILGGDDQRD